LGTVEVSEAEQVNGAQVVDLILKALDRKIKDLENQQQLNHTPDRTPK
jgi:hypothetical protein